MTDVQKYPLLWRILHWVMALMIAALIPIGIWMAERAEANIFDTLTNTLYAWHKAIGFSVLLLMVLRVAVKVRLKSPDYPDSISPQLKAMAKGLHHLMYVLLILTPLFGWAGVTAFPALITLGGYDLPAMPGVPQDSALATTLFEIHGALAFTLIVLVIGHIGAAIRHMLRKDGLVRRML